MWLLEENVRLQLEEARKSANISAADQREHEVKEAALAKNGPQSLSVMGDVAEIRVEGVLTKKPNWILRFFGFGNTSYTDLLQAIAQVRGRPDVKRVQFFVDSPGGAADGLVYVLAALQDLREVKKTRVRAENAYSAAYGIAAAAGPIEATGPGSMFGSVGVAVRYAQRADVEIFDITNTASPDKRPDPATEQGRAVIRRELDAIFDLFAEAIAKGRGTTKENVIENFGRGASFVARDAQRRGMIDTVRAPRLQVVGADAEPTELPSAAAPAPAPAEPPAEPPAAESETDPTAHSGGVQPTREGKQMSELTMNTLRAQHPDLYEAVVQEGVKQGRDQGLEEGKKLGREEGGKKEHTRVMAHLKLGQKVGAMDLAAKYIESGASVMDEDVHADYLAAGLNRNERQTRQQETDTVGAVLDKAPSGTEPDFESKVMDVVERELAGVAG